MREQRAVGRNHHRVAVLADANPIHHPPHFLEAELPDQHAGRLIQVAEVNGKDAGRQQVVVDAQRRERDAVERDRRVRRNGDTRPADAARGQGGAGFVEEADLAEFAEPEDVVLEDAVLLPRLQAGVLQIGGERREDLRVLDEIAADFLGGAGGDVRVAGDDGFVGAAPQRQDGDDAERDERDDGGGSEEEREADGDAANVNRHQGISVPGCLCVLDRFPEPQRAENVAARLGGRHRKTSTDSAGAHRPRQEDCRGVIQE